MKLEKSKKLQDLIEMQAMEKLAIAASKNDISIIDNMNYQEVKFIFDYFNNEENEQFVKDLGDFDYFMFRKLGQFFFDSMESLGKVSRNK